MRISIAMATYNGAKYLREQLQSFVDQTRQPDELIISDDCSTDETEAIVRSFAQNAPFVVEFYRNEKNLGYCGNFNAALMRTSGDLVFLSDQDDVWFPTKIERHIQIAEQNYSSLVFCSDAMIASTDLTNSGLTKIQQLIYRGASIDNHVMGCCCSIRRDFLKICLPIPTLIKAHDNWIVELADILNVRLIVDEVHQLYRRHENNTSQSLDSHTKKIKKLDKLIYSWTQYKSRNNTNEDLEKLCQMKCFAKELESLVTKVGFEDQIKLKGDLERRLRIIELEQERQSIRRKRIFSRLWHVLKLSANKKYKNVNGIQSAIRDLLG